MSPKGLGLHPICGAPSLTSTATLGHDTSRPPPHSSKAPLSEMWAPEPWPSFGQRLMHSSKRTALLQAVFNSIEQL
eukprot:3874101-Alexandrium_andersonii.AAC.1